MACRWQRFLTIIILLVMLGACAPATPAPGATTPPVTPVLARAPAVAARTLPMPISNLDAPMKAVPVASLPVSVTLGAIALTLPAGWAANADPVAIRNQLAISNGTPQLIAWSQGADFQQAGLRLSVVQTPRQGLTLQRYVAAVAASLAQQDGISVVQAETSTALRRDGLPAGQIQYRVAGSTGETHGYQLALLNTTGDQLVLLTFASMSGLVSSAESTFDTIVRTIEPLP